ncbi:MAG: S-adenosyl-L-methionine-dependent methyltransferase [Piptocephalis tieghemiana]|nr:MAG: S-adenosyl-L-methionine-dependent methyltransferase [Piptocephalis tieghemiana]
MPTAQETPARRSLEPPYLDLAFLASLPIPILILIAPSINEPIYGNILSHAHYPTMAYTILLISLAKVLLPSPNLSSWPSLTRSLLLSSLLLVLSPWSLGFLSRYSTFLGPEWGPHVSQVLISYLPIALLSSSLGASIKMAHSSSSSSSSSPLIYLSILVISVWFALVILPNPVHTLLLDLITSHLSFLPTLLFLGSFLSLAALVLSFIHTFSSHALDHVNHRHSWTQAPVTLLILFLALFTLKSHPYCDQGFSKAYIAPGWKGIDRAESLTGLISVVEKQEKPVMRLLRAGHSLIGGAYLHNMDSIYDSFYFLEAVRLIKRPSKPQNQPLNALVIGLGIGVSARSLMKHKINVDIVEIDPVVYRFSRTYFDLPEPRATYLMDGRKFLEEAKDASYDYILHDVFTGGSVPPGLFSKQILSHIKRVLTPDGILALNFLGSMEWPLVESYWIVARTIQEVFPHVKMHLEMDTLDHKVKAKVFGSIINVVFFASDKPIQYRDPVEEDYLDGDMRWHALQKFRGLERPLDIPANVSVLTDGDNQLEKHQYLLSLMHWHVMRHYLPLDLWVNY